MHPKGADRMENSVDLDDSDKKNEPSHDKLNKMAYAPSEDSDQLGHPPSLIRVFAARFMGG